MKEGKRGEERREMIGVVKWRREERGRKGREEAEGWTSRSPLQLPASAAPSQRYRPDEHRVKALS